MDDFYSIKVNHSKPVPNTGKNVVLIILIIILLAADAGIIYLFYRTGKVISSITHSAQTAAKTSNRWSLFNVSADANLPESDVAGEEMFAFNRYPNSIRTKYQKTDLLTSSEYQTLDASNLVLTYYKSQLAKSGWVLNYTTDKEISFIRDNQEVKIQTNLADNITTYLINLIQK